MSCEDLIDEVLIVLTLVIDYVTYTYNTIISMIFLKLLNQSPLEVHTPTQSYHPAILVTGTSVGIGRDTALTLAKQGYTVFATVRRKEDAEDLSNEFEQHDNVMNGRLITLMMDVTSKEDIQKAYDSVCSTIGNDIPFVGLVNNAALILYMPLELASEKTYEESFNTNYFSVINLTKKFLPLLRRGKGRVVNLGSMAAWSPAPTTGVYSSTKAAIRAITQVWRMETRCMGVHFSLVEAGAVATRFTENQMATFRNFTSFPSNSKYYELSHNITSNVKESYENLFRMVALRSSLFSRSIPPAVVTDAIIHALTHQYPKNTYYVGLDARLVAAASWLLGDRVAEAIQGKALAVPNCPSDMISVM